MIQLSGLDRLIHSALPLKIRDLYSESAGFNIAGIRLSVYFDFLTVVPL